MDERERRNVKNTYQISVIVPVYNGEKYLSRAVDSLIAQTIFEDLEMIIVDDGSTDKTPAILDGYSARYANILVYHIPNGGVSNARNYGIRRASGAYLGFLDADDWVEPDYYSRLFVRLRETNADAAACGFVIETDNGRVIANDVPAGAETCPGSQALKDFLQGQIDVHVFTKLFRRELIQNLSFDPSLHYGEDRLFSLTALTKAKTVALVNECFYHYYMNTDSAMHQTLSQRSFENLEVGARTVEYVSRHSPELVPYAQCEEVNTKCRLLGEIILQNKKEEYAQYYHTLRRDIRTFPLATAYRYASRKHFLALLLAKVNPGWYGLLRSNPFLRFKK